MTPRDLLGVIIRSAGLVHLLLSLYDLYFVLAKSTGIPTQSTYPITYGISGFLAYFVVGMALLFVTPQLVKLAFCSEKKTS
jgi:hypothetical protein